jgi:outer membrane lipase/esterase
MAANWMRRTVLVAAVASAALLAACGSSTTESAIAPQRFIAFGDAVSDVGQNGTRYTVNDGSINNWTLQVAANYGKPLAAASAGGTSYAVGNARVKLKPDAAGNASTPTITEQIDTFLARGSFGASDVVFLSGGISDVIAGMAAVQAGTQTEAAMVAAARQAGEDFAAQVRRLVTAGAKYVVVTGTYDLSKTPWAKSIGRETLLNDASSRFNDGLLVGIVDLGANVLYVDSAYYVNLYTGVPANYGFNNATTPVCTSVDPANGIGIGAGQVNSARCTSSTLLAGADPVSYVFADPVYLTPSAQRQFGTYAYDRLRARW